MLVVVGCTRQMNWVVFCECIWGSDVWFAGGTQWGAGAMRAAAQGYRYIKYLELARVGIIGRVN